MIFFPMGPGPVYIYFLNRLRYGGVERPRHLFVEDEDEKRRREEEALMAILLALEE